jgi:serine protease Do
MRISLLAHTLFMALVMSLALAFYPSNAHADNHTPPGSFADLAEKLLPAVVNISSTQKIEANIELP